MTEYLHDSSITLICFTPVSQGQFVHIRLQEPKEELHAHAKTHGINSKPNIPLEFYPEFKIESMSLPATFSLLGSSSQSDAKEAVALQSNPDAKQHPP